MNELIGRAKSMRRLDAAPPFIHWSALRKKDGRPFESLLPDKDGAFVMVSCWRVFTRTHSSDPKTWHTIIWGRGEREKALDHIYDLID